jgi:Ca2+-transporting ATPase
MWEAFQDKVLILLTIVAVVSLALGLYQSFGQPHPNGRPKVEWMEGVAIIVTVIVIVAVSFLNDFQMERQFLMLNKKVNSTGLAAKGDY